MCDCACAKFVIMMNVTSKRGVLVARIMAVRLLLLVATCSWGELLLVR